MITSASKNWIGWDNSVFKSRRIIHARNPRPVDITYSPAIGGTGKIWPKGRAINERRIREGKINAANMGTDGPR